MESKRRELIVNALFTLLSMYAAAWLGYLVAIVPAYVLRGAYYGDDRTLAEHLVFGLCGLAASAVILILLHRRSDRAERLTRGRAFAEAGIAAALYAAAQILYRLISENSYLVAVHVIHLSSLFGTAESTHYPARYPTLPASLLGALLSCTVYFLSTVLGMRLAGKRRQKNDPRKGGSTR